MRSVVRVELLITYDDGSQQIIALSPEGVLPSEYVPMSAPKPYLGLVFREGRAFLNGNEVFCSLFQLRFLKALWEARGGLVRRNDMVDAVWQDEGVDGVSEQALDAMARRARDKISHIPSKATIITARGIGWRWGEPVPGMEEHGSITGRAWVEGRAKI